MLYAVFEKARAWRRRNAIGRALPVISTGDNVAAVLGAAKRSNPFVGSDIKLVVTDHTVVVLRRSTLTLRGYFPQTLPRCDVTVEKWEPRPRWSKLKLRTPDGVIDLRIDRIHHEEGTNLVGLLGATGPESPRRSMA